jgi:hypothetical protein
VSPRDDSRWKTAGALLLALSAIAQLAYGAAAIGGDDALQANIREIEANPQFGTLYFGLAAWGVILVIAGIAQALAGWALARRAPHGRLLGLGATLLGLGAAFFTLAIFHVAALITLVLLIAAMYVLSYRIRDDAPTEP